MCKTLDPFDALYGDDCPIHDTPNGPACGAEANTLVEDCLGKTRGPFCPHHAARVAKGAHIVIGASQDCPRRVQVSRGIEWRPEPVEADR